jgi:hypothetical protein
MDVSKRTIHLTLRNMASTNEKLWRLRNAMICWAVSRLRSSTCWRNTLSLETTYRRHGIRMQCPQRLSLTCHRPQRCTPSPIGILPLQLSIRPQTQYALIPLCPRGLLCAMHPAIEITTGMSLSAETTIAPGLRIHHFGGIIVPYKAILGEGCTLYDGVTLSARLSVVLA